MHLTSKCTGLSHEVIFGLSTVIHNVLLLCHSCIELKKKDQIIDQIISSRDEPEQKQFEENVKTLRNEGEEIKNNLNVNNLFVQQQLQELKENMDNKKFPPLEPKVTQLPQKPKEINKEAFDGIGLRGIPELKSNNSRERYNHDINEAKSLIAHLAVEGNFKELKGIGKGRN